MILYSTTGRYVFMKSRVEIKAEAKAVIRTGRVSPLIVSAIVIVIGLVLSEVSSLVDTGELSYMQLFYELGLAERPDVIDRHSQAAAFLSTLASLVNTVLNAGYLSYLMGIRKGWEMPYSSLLDGLSIAGKIIWCNILMGIKIFLWSMLFIVPGIIASYRYRFALYNIIENPSLSVSEAIALSCRQTEGMKMELFVLDVSFFGWDLVTILTGGVAGIWTRPYIALSDLGYYEMGCHRVGTPPRQDTTYDPSRNDTPWEL